MYQSLHFNRVIQPAEGSTIVKYQFYMKVRDGYTIFFCTYEDFSGIYLGDFSITPEEMITLSVCFMKEEEYMKRCIKEQIANAPTRNNIPKISAKLAAEGMAQSNYDKDRATAILSKTVMPRACLKVLELFETEVIEGLPEFPEEE